MNQVSGNHQPHSRARVRGFTLTELMIVVVILAVLAAVSVPQYYAATKAVRIRRAIADIRQISQDLLSYQARYGVVPDNLEDVGHGDRLDPWGRPYEYLALETVEEVVVPKKKTKKAKKKKKRAKKKWKPDPEAEDQDAPRLGPDGKPINVLFDLYSSGRDGTSDLSLSDKDSQDDVVLADNGDFIDLASKYK